MYNKLYNEVLQPRQLVSGYVIRFVLIFLLLGPNISIYSQRLYGHELLQYYMNILNAEYDCPKGWTENFEEEMFLPADYLVSASNFRIISPKEDVIIVFSYSPELSVEDSVKIWPLITRLNPDRSSRLGDPLQRKTVEIQMDTLCGRPNVVWKKKFARRKFGTDYAGHYPGRQAWVYRDKYDHHEVVWLHNVGVGTIWLRYYYVRGTDIDRYVKETIGMMRFKKGKKD